MDAFSDILPKCMQALNPKTVHSHVHVTSFGMECFHLSVFVFEGELWRHCQEYQQSAKKIIKFLFLNKQVFHPGGFGWCENLFAIKGFSKDR